MESVKVYKGRDNSFDLVLKKNDINLTENEMNAITKFEIKFNGIYYDSGTTSAGFVKDAANAKVTVKPFELDLPVALDSTVELIIYDNGDYTNGLVWDQFTIEVSNAAEPAA